MKQSFLITVLSVLCIQTAWAQQVAREDTLSIQDYEMNEVVIQAFKQHQDLKVAPVAKSLSYPEHHLLKVEEAKTYHC